MVVYHFLTQFWDFISDSNIVCTPLEFVILNKKFSRENVTPYGKIWEHVNFGVTVPNPKTERDKTAGTVYYMQNNTD